MVNFKATIRKFAGNGEKTGWTFVEIPASTAVKLHKKDKRSFRVKGKIDKTVIEGVALIPMGGGDYILPLNADIRRLIRKKEGSTVELVLEVDHAEPELPAELFECLEAEPQALENFRLLKKGERNYFIKWILSAKTDATRAKRMALSIDAFLQKTDFGSMIRQQKKDQLPG